MPCGVRPVGFPKVRRPVHVVMMVSVAAVYTAVVPTAATPPPWVSYLGITLHVCLVVLTLSFLHCSRLAPRSHITLPVRHEFISARLKELCDKMGETNKILISSSTKSVRQRREMEYTPKDFDELVKDQELIIKKLQADISDIEPEELFG
ncbi:hypothetical protein GGR51DRAFT_297733 [Nemania sp. FL0031]|nr:hypothetical protein GGR51DRAFT_297733 [Nemania sp. FL0031]